MKKIVLALAAVLAVSSFAACTTTDQKLIFNDYWEQNSLAPSSSLEETLEYKVSFEKGSGLDAVGYSLSYGEGTYVTTLKSQGQGYVYTTSLTIPVTYQYEGDESATKTDSVQTEVVFQRSSNALRPVSSKKSVVSHTPINSGAFSTESCFSPYNFSVETTYPTEGKATSTVTYNKGEGDPDVVSSSFNFDGGKYSYLDNEQLLLALRAISTSTSSGSVKIYNPYVETTQKIDLTFSEAVGAEFSYTLNGVQAKTNITYRPVTIKIDDKNPGSSQTAWIATTSNPENNEHRNVMLKLVTPLSYSLGELVYELVSITRA